MLELILGSLLVIVTGLAIHATWCLHREMLTNTGYAELIRHQQAQLGGDDGVIVRLHQEVDQIRSDARVEAREYLDRAMHYEKMLTEKNRQISNMAERVASLKLVPSVEGGEDMHVEEVVPEKPYSPELHEWINGLTDSESRNSAHDFVEIRRAHGIFDEVILQELEEEWTA